MQYNATNVGRLLANVNQSPCRVSPMYKVERNLLFVRSLERQRHGQKYTLTTYVAHLRGDRTYTIEASQRRLGHGLGRRLIMGGGAEIGESELDGLFEGADVFSLLVIGNVDCVDCVEQFVLALLNSKIPTATIFLIIFHTSRPLIDDLDRIPT